MIKFVIKSALAGGTVYYVSEQNVWKDTNESLKTCEAITNSVQPYVNQVKALLPFEVPELPETDKFSFIVQESWNKTVLTTFNFLSNLPHHLNEWRNEAVEKVYQNATVNDLLHPKKEVKIEVETVKK